MIKTVLAHLSGTTSDSSVLAASIAAAHLYEAHIAGTLVLPDPQELVRRAARIDASDALLLGEAFDAMEQNNKARDESTQAAFAAFCTKENVVRTEDPIAGKVVTASWKTLIGDVGVRLGAEGRFHDLLVLSGGPERDGRLSVGELGQVILSCGKPVLITTERESNQLFDTVGLAWKATPESARAVTAAMPFLKHARRVEVISVNEHNESALECVGCCEDIVRQLRWHNINAHMHFVIAGGRSIADAIFETAHERGCNLLVMGAYGHSRLRELIFGGVTRRILSGVDIPVLLFH